MDVSKDAGRAIWKEECCVTGRKENHMFQDEVALMRTTTAWRETRWTYSMWREEWGGAGGKVK